VNTLALIKKYGLSVRQIPLQVVSLMEMHRHVPGNEVVEREVTGRTPAQVRKHLVNSDNFRFDDKNNKVFCRYTRSVRTPEHAGWWMCQQSRGTGSTVSWGAKTDNLASTLEESVSLCVKQLKAGGYHPYLATVL